MNAEQRRERRTACRPPFPPLSPLLRVHEEEARFGSASARFGIRVRGRISGAAACRRRYILRLTPCSHPQRGSPARCSRPFPTSRTRRTSISARRWASRRGASPPSAWSRCGSSRRAGGREGERAGRAGRRRRRRGRRGADDLDPALRGGDGEGREVHAPRRAGRAGHRAARPRGPHRGRGGAPAGGGERRPRRARHRRRRGGVARAAGGARRAGRG